MSRETTQDGDRSSILFIKHSWIPTSTPANTIANLVTVSRPPSSQFSPAPTTHNGELRDRQQTWHFPHEQQVRLLDGEGWEGWQQVNKREWPAARMHLPRRFQFSAAGCCVPAPSPNQGSFFFAS